MVSPLTNEGILGLDLLKRHDAMIDVGGVNGGTTNIKLHQSCHADKEIVATHDPVIAMAECVEPWPVEVANTDTQTRKGDFIRLHSGKANPWKSRTGVYRIVNHLSNSQYQV